MAIFKKAATNIKKLLKCEFNATEYDGSIGVNNDAISVSNENVNRNGGINNTGYSTSRREINLNNHRQSHHQTNVCVNDFICINNDNPPPRSVRSNSQQQNNDDPPPVPKRITLVPRSVRINSQQQNNDIPPPTEPPPLPPPPRRITSVPRSVRSNSQRQNAAAAEKLSKTFKEYVQRQLEELTEDTLNYKGTKDNQEYRRLHIRINRELKSLEAMEINDNVLENKLKTQVIHLRKVLSFNAKIRKEQMDQEEKINERKNAIVKTQAITPIHQPIAKEDIENLTVHLQKQKDQEALIHVRRTLDGIHGQLVVLRECVFYFCSHQKNQEYLHLEASINHELNMLQNTNTHKNFPELDPQKSEIEQFGRTWLKELQRRLEEMQIRRYQARVKALW